MSIERRAEVHAALGDQGRLAIVDELAISDRAPSELAARLQMPRNLLAFHLNTLERAALIARHVSTADRRRKYVRLVHDALEPIGLTVLTPDRPVVFVCTRNSARSQLAAAIWRAERHQPAFSAGTEPADAVHPGAVAAARRAGVELGEAPPRPLDDDDHDRHIITVCDRAHEELAPERPTWHWSIADPVDDGSDRAFDDAVASLRHRIGLFPATPTSPTDQEYT